MIELIELFDICTITVSVVLLYKNRNKVSYNSQFIFYVLFFLLYVIPLFLDYFVAPMDYSYAVSDYGGFIISRKDLITNFIYDSSLIYCQYILLYYKNKTTNRVYQNNVINTPIKYYNFILLSGAVFPILASIYFLKNTSILYVFGWRELKMFEVINSYSSIERFTYVGVTCSILLLLAKGKLFNFYRFISIPFLYMNICIQGKRGILFFAIITIAIIVYFQFVRHVILKKSIKLYAIFVAILVASSTIYMIYTSVVVKEGRGYVEESQLYTTLRVDFFRDDRVRTAIYSELYPSEVPMLEYPCQTIINNILFIVPINYIAEALDIDYYSYQTYFTFNVSRVKFDSSKADYYTKMTVTIFAELISNLSIFGILFFPFICIWFAKLTNRYKYPINILIICSFVLLNLFSFNYIVIFLETTLFICIIHNYFFDRKIFKGNNLYLK